MTDDVVFVGKISDNTMHHTFEQDALLICVTVQFCLCQLCEVVSIVNVL